MIKIELESLFSMNYLIQKRSQVQNDHKTMHSEKNKIKVT